MVNNHNTASSSSWWVLVVVGLAAPVQGQDIHLSLERTDATWSGVVIAPDGATGAAARFEQPDARIDIGPCPISDDAPLHIALSIRTTRGEFATPLMARDGDRVGLSFVMGRTPGTISFEAWSWESVRLISKSRVDDGQWHRAEVDFDPACHGAVLRIDGRVEAWGVLGPGGSPTAKLRLGNNIGADQPFNGDLDDVTIERRAKVDEACWALAELWPQEKRAAQLRALRDQILGRSAPMPSTPEAWRDRRAQTRAALLDALGLTPFPPREPGELTVHGAIDGDGFTVQRVSFPGWPGKRLTGWLWLPNPRPTGRVPAILDPHGHWADGAIDPCIQARAAHQARHGCIAFALDSVHVEDVAAGVSSVGAMTWHLMRALDYLLSRDDVDPARIGVTGESGGGQQTMYMMGTEDRVAAAAPVCMISPFSEILDETSAHCWCNHAPRVGWIADAPMICALHAPKPALFISSKRDWTRDFATNALPRITRVYELLGAPAAVESAIFDADHGYDANMRARSYSFFTSALHVDGLTTPESFQPIALDRLRALGPPPVALDGHAQAQEHMARRDGGLVLRDVAPALPWELHAPRMIDGGPLREDGAWRRILARDGDIEVPALFKNEGQGNEPFLVVAAADGKTELLMDPPAWLRDARRVAIVEPRFTGEWKPFADAWRRNGILLGCGEGYLAAHDIAVVCGALPGPAGVTVVGLGQNGVAAMLAAKICPRIERLIIRDLGPPFSQDGNRLPLCPEILRVNDLPELLVRLDGPRHITVGGFSGSFRSLPVGTSLRLSGGPLSERDIAAALAPAGR